VLRLGDAPGKGMGRFIGFGTAVALPADRADAHGAAIADQRRHGTIPGRERPAQVHLALCHGPGHETGLLAGTAPLVQFLVQGAAQGTVCRQRALQFTVISGLLALRRAFSRLLTAVLTPALQVCSNAIVSFIVFTSFDRTRMPQFLRQTLLYSRLWTLYNMDIDSNHKEGLCPWIKIMTGSGGW